MSCAAPPWWQLSHGFRSQWWDSSPGCCSATSGRGPPTGEAAAGRRLQHPRALAAPRGGRGGGQVGAGGATFNCNGSTRGDSSSRSCGARPRTSWSTGRDAAARCHTAPAAASEKEVQPCWDDSVIPTSCDSPAEAEPEE
nr:unnamed protein product [Digitaria exilis]